MEGGYFCYALSSLFLQLHLAQELYICDSDWSLTVNRQPGFRREHSYCSLHIAAQSKYEELYQISKGL